MGCCASSGTADRDNEEVSEKNTTIVEEETVVKEVLSETTFLPTSSDIHSPGIKQKIHETEEKKLKTGHEPGMTRPDLIDPEEGSEVSEICSLSLSLSESVSSTIVKNGYDEDEVMMMKQRKSQRSPAKTRTRVTGNNNNNYPTRRTDQSPRKRNTGLSNGARVGSGTRDPAERSGRRSRSPAMNRSVMDSNQSRVSEVRTKKSLQSPGRVRLDPNNTGSYQQRYVNHGYSTNESPGRVRLDPNKTVSDQQLCQNHDYTTEELLENPLVSLECFIFL